MPTACHAYIMTSRIDPTVEPRTRHYNRLAVQQNGNECCGQNCLIDLLRPYPDPTNAFSQISCTLEERADFQHRATIFDDRIDDRQKKLLLIAFIRRVISD